MTVRLTELDGPDSDSPYGDALHDGHWTVLRGVQVWQPIERPATPPCPTCGVIVGGCRTRNGYPAGAEHAARGAG